MGGFGNIECDVVVGVPGSDVLGIGVQKCTGDMTVKNAVDVCMAGNVEEEREQ